MCSCTVCAARSTRAGIYCTPSAALAMSSNLVNRFGRTISFRLNLWYAAIFIVSACALFLFLYFLLAVAIERKDREVVEAKFKEYSTVYAAGGLPALQSRVGGAQEAGQQKPFFVRWMS